MHSNCLPQDNYIIILQDNHEIFQTILFLSSLTLMERSLNWIFIFTVNFGQFYQSLSIWNNLPFHWPKDLFSTFTKWTISLWHHLKYFFKKYLGTYEECPFHLKIFFKHLCTWSHEDVWEMRFWSVDSYETVYEHGSKQELKDSHLSLPHKISSLSCIFSPYYTS